ncbi:MAG TPA: zinc-binding dehydrogenase [Bdellovibrionota bacterium]|nr:zinc-binding dehydrogenase [Bdellovibrionota bacterium]
MIAYRFSPGQKTLKKEDLDIPTAGPNDAVLRVRAAGVCHSDLHVLDGEVPFLKNTFTMGHEVCGELMELGSEVPATLFETGALYAVHGPNPCGNCQNCRLGRDNLCDGPGRAYIGLGADGGYADFIKVPARNIVRVPEGVSPEVAAVATDAVLTPWHAFKTLANIRQGDTVLVIGLGGLGMNGMQIAHALGAHVIASDVRESSLEMARELGADEVFHSKELEEKIKGRRIDVAGDFVGRESTFRQAQTLVSPGGIVSAVGLGALQVPFMPMIVASYEIRVQGSFWGTSVELKEVLRYIAEGKISPQVETGKLEDTNYWIEELKNGRVKSRMALMPKAAEAQQPKAA